MDNLQVSGISARLDALLRPEPPAPEYERNLQPLAGVRWPRGKRRTPLAGEVALFDVADPGELQDWET